MKATLLQPSINEKGGKGQDKLVTNQSMILTVGDRQTTMNLSFWDSRGLPAGEYDFVPNLDVGYDGKIFVRNPQPSDFHKKAS